jgi:glycosyltransferase involved in cell wall biosynthesis
MKILFFIDNLMSGGKERRFVELLKGLKAFPSIEFEIVIMNEDVHYKEVFELQNTIHFLIRKTKKDLSIFYKIYKICKIYRPDIIHCFDSMSAVYLSPICSLLRLKLINGMISDAPEKLNIFNTTWLRARITFPFSAIIIGNSEAGLKAYKTPPKKSLVIHKGFNFKRIENLANSDSIRNGLKIKTKFVIGMVASFSKYKDYKTYFKAAELVLSERNDVTFIAIGNKTDSMEAATLIDDNYRDVIKTIGKKTNVESYINAMDICVLATFTEGISNSILEYMALAKPVIATSGGGTNEIVKNAKTGFLVKPSDPSDLAEKIILLLNDFNLRYEMGTEGVKRVHKTFSIETMVSKYVFCYENLQKKKNNRKSKSLKVLFFIDSLRAGGKERRCVELLKGLNASPDIDFEIVVMNENIHYKEVFYLNTKIHYLIRKTKKDLSVFQKFYNISKEYKPDVVHCWNDMTAVIAVPTCKLLKIKFVNGMVADTPIRRNIMNKSWLRARLTFAFSSKIIGNSKAGLIGYGAPPKKSSCIYNGMDFNRFKNLKDPNVLRRQIFGDDCNNIFVAGMVAAFEPRKDYKTFIKAALLLIELNASIRFILVGDGTDFIQIKNSVPLKFSNKIIFLGKRNDVESIVNLFDVGILLTNSKVHGEGISNSIIEYMALGKPVIATRGGGTNEVVINHQNGYLIDSDDSSQMVEYIQRLIHDKKLVAQLGSKSYEIARCIFDLKIMTQNYIQTYQQVLQENKN